MLDVGTSICSNKVGKDLHTIGDRISLDVVSGFIGGETTETEPTHNQLNILVSWKFATHLTPNIVQSGIFWRFHVFPTDIKNTTTTMLFVRVRTGTCTCMYIILRS